MDDINKSKDNLVNQRIGMLTKRTCKQVIVDKTAQVLQGFVLELALGNTKYRSLHNLTEQVEHQYSERFLVELGSCGRTPVYRRAGSFFQESFSDALLRKCKNLQPVNRLIGLRAISPR